MSYSHFFSKNNGELDIVLTRKVNILTTNELVKLTMLWTSGPSIFDWKKKKKKKSALLGAVDICTRKSFFTAGLALHAYMNML